MKLRTIVQRIYCAHLKVLSVHLERLVGEVSNCFGPAIGKAGYWWCQRSYARSARFSHRDRNTLSTLTSTPSPRTSPLIYEFEKSERRVAGRPNCLETEMQFSEKLQNLITNAWADGHVCLLGTIGKDGPNISPKGSMIVFDDQHLAYWERSKKKALENLQHDNRVVVVILTAAQRAAVLDSGVLRFYGTSQLHKSGPSRDAIFSKLLKREQEYEGADTGMAC